MKRLIMLLAYLMCAICTLRAELLLTEDFQYTISSDLTDNGWFTSWGSPSDIIITNGLEFPGYAGCGVGGAAVLDVNSGANQPHLTFTEVTSADVYVAFLFQSTVNYKSGYFFCLRDTAVSGYTFNYVARVYLSKDYKLGLSFGKADGNVAYSDYVLDGQKVYLLVLKYTIVTGDNNDRVSLYAFSQMPTTEPTEPLLILTNDNTLPDINPANLTLRGYDDKGFLVVDGFRVATTWSEAVALGNGNCDGAQPSALPNTQNTLEDGVIYDVLGRSISTPTQHGIYICNGRKVVL